MVHFISSFIRKTNNHATIYTPYEYCILMHVNYMNILVQPHIPVALNCLIHIPMYWYFAFPKELFILIETNYSNANNSTYNLLNGYYLYIFSRRLKQNKYGANYCFSLFNVFILFLYFYINIIKKK